MSQRRSLPLVSSEEDPFILAILAAPEDEAPRLIYADWLEERGDPRGEYLRLDCRLAGLPQDDQRFDGMVTSLRELSAWIDQQWLRAVARSNIEKCGFRFRFRCPKQWDRLQLTEESSVRFCSACLKNVYYCGGLEEARDHVGNGHCVALDPNVARSAGDLDPDEELSVDGMIVGDFDATWEPEPRESDPERRNKSRPWWRFWA
jgi:uncharacterized protein (TIGR02996 family)